MSTTLMRQKDVRHGWYVVDAAGKPLGRLAVRVAARLRGRHKVTYTPHMDDGDFIVVVNAAQVALTGRKEEQKIYAFYSGYRSGLKEFTAEAMRQRHPERMIELAVRGMLPKNRQSRAMLRRLKVYAGADHPHGAQNPQALDLKV